MAIKFLKIKQQIDIPEMYEKLEEEVLEVKTELAFGDKDHQLDEILDVIESAIGLLMLVSDYDFDTIEQASIKHIAKLKSRDHEVLSELVLSEQYL